MTRPIDADALRERLQNLAYDDWNQGIIKSFADTCNEIIEIVEEQPTIDAVPVRHGEWIDETFKPWGLVHHPFKCNLCGEHAEFASPYCPNCGAKMYETQKKPCDDCQEFDCYGCEYSERKEE